MKRFILTVGPALLHKVSINDIHSKENIYRINGAHGSIEDIESYINKIRAQVPTADILMDLPGNKVRTSNIVDGIVLENGKEFFIQSQNFNYPEFYKHLKPGMTVWANDSIFEFNVISATEEKITFLSKSDGILINNKGVHVRGIHQDIPFLFSKDRQLIELANKYRLAFVGLSFVRTAADVQDAQALIATESQIISKIETLDAVRNLADILKLVKYILIDRGDLSTDIGLNKVPQYQKFIVEKALFSDVKVFLATQVLKSMETKPIPNIGEIEALYSIYKSGVFGVQMSEETAVGKYPAECIQVLRNMRNDIEKELIYD